jgi:hypothetical protein
MMAKERFKGDLVLKKIIYVLFLCLILVILNVSAQQTEEVQKDTKLQKSKFDELFKIKDKIVFNESYTVIKREKDTSAVLARVGWVEGEKNKIYAASFESTVFKYITIDFDRLVLLKADLERVIEKIEKAMEDDKINAVRYISPDDIYINYYEWEYMNEKNSNLYFKYGDSIFQDKTTERLKSFLDSIDKVQAKLISLGATRQINLRKK